MIKVTNWTAKRSGGKITIECVNAETGEPMRIVGIDVIKGPRFGTAPAVGSIAFDKTNMREYELE